MHDGQIKWSSKCKSIGMFFLMREEVRLDSYTKVYNDTSCNFDVLLRFYHIQKIYLKYLINAAIHTDFFSVWFLVFNFIPKEKYAIIFKSMNEK